HYLSQINYRQNIPGDLLHRFENCFLISFILTQVFWWALGSMIFVILAAVIMLYLNWEITILVFIIMPLSFYLARLIGVEAERQSIVREHEENILFNMSREEIDFHAFIPLLRLKKYRIKKFKQQLSIFGKKDIIYNTFLLLTNTVIASSIVLLQ